MFEGKCIQSAIRLTLFAHGLRPTKARFATIKKLNVLSERSESKYGFAHGLRPGAMNKKSNALNEVEGQYS